MKHIFISYARTDALRIELTKGTETFFNDRSIVPDFKFEDRILEELYKYPVFLLILVKDISKQIRDFFANVDDIGIRVVDTRGTETQDNKLKITESIKQYCLDIANLAREKITKSLFSYRPNRAFENNQYTYLTTPLASNRIGHRRINTNNTFRYGEDSNVTTRPQNEAVMYCIASQVKGLSQLDKMIHRLRNDKNHLYIKCKPSLNFAFRFVTFLQECLYMSLEVIQSSQKMINFVYPVHKVISNPPDKTISDTVPIDIANIYDPNGNASLSMTRCLTNHETDIAYNLCDALEETNGSQGIDVRFCDDIAYIYIPHNQRIYSYQNPVFDIATEPTPTAPMPTVTSTEMASASQADMHMI